MGFKKNDINQINDETIYFMQEALREAKKAYKKEEVPIGAVIVKNGEIVAKAHNLREIKKNALAHAEILAINKACKKLETWRLIDCDMYVTLEPCTMCAGAILNSRIKNLYIAASEPKTGAVGSKLNIFSDYVFNHKVYVKSGVCEEEAKKLMQQFFKELRVKEKKQRELMQEERK